jgi:hypothetical protein
VTVKKVKPPVTLASMIFNSGGRRFAISLAALVSAHWLAWSSHINGDAYALVMVGVVGAFITGVTVQKVKGGTSDG